MAGADEVVAESGGVIAVLPETDAGGLHKLSPYGELCREFYRFTQQYPQVGNAYVPLALLLDKYHGAYPGFEGRKAFGQFPYGPGDEMIWRVVDTFFPGGWEVQGKQETGCLVNTPYGDGASTCSYRMRPPMYLHAIPCCCPPAMCSGSLVK